MLKSGSPENMTSLPELASVVEEWLKSSPPDNTRGTADLEVEDVTRRLRTVIAITPMTITAAAPIAMRAEMLRMLFLWARIWGIEPGGESEELGLRTIGLGRTVGQVLSTAAPQREGLNATEEGEIVLKKLPPGNAPWSWL